MGVSFVKISCVKVGRATSRLPRNVKMLWLWRFLHRIHILYRRNPNFFFKSSSQHTLQENMEYGNVLPILLFWKIIWNYWSRTTTKSLRWLSQIQTFIMLYITLYVYKTRIFLYLKAGRIYYGFEMADEIEIFVNFHPCPKYSDH